MKINKDMVAKKLMERRTLVEESNPQLVTQLNVILADTMLFYFKSHSFHWNVEGANFNDYHAFFAAVYTATFANVDPLAEHIRMLSEYAPNSLQQLIAGASIREVSTKPGSASEMFSILKSDNEKIIAGLKSGKDIANSTGVTDVANYLEELITAQRKLAWMLDALLKG
jgi:starvation-inducible DNA-binding protein